MPRRAACSCCEHVNNIVELITDNRSPSLTAGLLTLLSQPRLHSMHAWMNGKRKVLLSVEKKTSFAPFFSKSLQKLLDRKEEEKLFTPFLGAENSGRISCTSESFSRNICESFGCHKSREIHRECLFLFMLRLRNLDRSKLKRFAQKENQ